MRELTEREKKMMEDDEVGCMDPRAQEALGKILFIVLMIVLGIIAGMAAAVIRWLF